MRSDETYFKNNSESSLGSKLTQIGSIGVGLMRSGAKMI